MASPEEASQQKPVSVLFVCLGNICRSTMGEGVFRSLVSQAPYKAALKDKGLIGRIDSCGTGAYHTGDPPDSRTLSTLEDHGITDYDHEARKVQLSDFEEFDYILAMDRSNLRDLQRLHQKHLSRKAEHQTSSRAKVHLFGEFSERKGHAEEVQDPYYGGRDGFETAYEQCVRFSKGFLKEVFGDVAQGR